MDATSPSSKVDELHELLERATTACFERKTKRRKSSEPPVTMTGGEIRVREWIWRRRAVFQRCGRNAVWKKMKRRTKDAITRE